MKRKRTKVYLSGGMEYAQKEGAGWRDELTVWIKSKLGHVVFNPVRESAKRFARKLPGESFRRLKSGDIQRYKKLVREVVDLDSAEIAHRSDYVVCFWDESAQKGAGTKGEITIARFFRKPVYLVTQSPLSAIPGWVLGCCDQFFNSFGDLKVFLEKKYQIKKRLNKQ